MFSTTSRQLLLPPVPREPSGHLGSADLFSPERANRESISQSQGRLGPGSDQPNFQSESPEHSPRGCKTGSEGWTPLQRASASSPGEAAGTRQHIRLYGLCSAVLAGPGLLGGDTDPRTPWHWCQGHQRYWCLCSLPHERQCPCSQTTLFKESLKAFTKSMQGFLGILIFKLNRDCNLGITEPRARKSSPVPLTQTCSAGRNKTLLGDLQPRGVGGSMWLGALPLSPVLPASYSSSIFQGT